MKCVAVYLIWVVCVLGVVVNSKDEREYRGRMRQGSGSKGTTGRPTDAPPDLDEDKNSNESDPNEESSEEIGTQRVGPGVVGVKRYPSQLGPEIEAMLQNGIPLDFGYNETEDDPERFISVPGCPESVKNTLGSHYDPWVYFGNPPKCFLSGSRGPCPEGMNLGIRPGSKYGICQCSCFNFTLGDGPPEQQLWNPFLNEVQSHCYDPKEDRNFVFYPKHKKCYALLTQGPCDSSEWLVLNKRNRAKCEKRTCPAEHFDPTLSSSTYPRVVRYFFQQETNSCVKFMTGCGKQREYILGRNNWIPECGPARSGRRYLGSEISPADCEGYGQSYSSYLQRCVTISTRNRGVG